MPSVPAVQTLRGELVELHRISIGDVDALTALWQGGGDDVQARWPVWSQEDLQGVVEGKDGAAGWWIREGETDLGFIQAYQNLDEEYRHASIDLFLVDRGQGRGLGTDAVRTLARHLVHDLRHHRLSIDPAADNGRAIRCYEKVGFRPVGRLREYERGPDGTWHDGLLMDLLARELT